ncbi:immunoglobulin-binding protein 1-like [Physella acuta]|uniref:immunoglobulin-binding protein 1-like n=1 Tax=Physella acuta TaxID=109671 RepID=UPI0027DC12F5|nr:immunoglobulin-binding protein 1-like [Physella acuta]XP_059150331.1 immunoglobulin-binding protein 1-like [Physella acuta]XP_059150332.1 immunoglobulin-binding protein 1-like [Physella acuta]XP_059150333.1 immunoglobulin-binding protein 1-like [Physella acuta]XP_059150334.1 immunoglobulin-binding protein 1-like [Physella acuta]
MEPASVDTCEDFQLSLPECYDRVFNLHQILEKTEESMASDKIQGQLRDGIIVTERAIQMVNDLDLFSRNEDIDEVSTNELKYMLLSAFLGYFICLNTHLPRPQAVAKAKLCYTDFLRLMKSYNVIEHDIHGTVLEEESDSLVPASYSRTRQDLNAMSAHRNNKIQRFKEKKEMEKKLAELKSQIERAHVDDEVKREFYLTQLKHWANQAIDEVDNCCLELQMLKHREEMTKPGAALQQAPSSSTKPFRPFILTKNELQKRVFGAGYPALATMTVDEFYEQKLKEGTLSESVHGGHSLQEWARDPDKDALAREKEDAEKEEKVERDDEELLARARAMDDWKDEHRRGDGNRHNKG